MEPEPLPDRPFAGVVHGERLYTMHVATLDHGIPVLAVALRETEHISVNMDRVRKMGLVAGPWLRDLKQAVRRCEAGDQEVRADTADDWCTVRAPGTTVYLGFHASPEYRRPVWPPVDGQQQAMAHLDVEVHDLAEAVERAVALGAVGAQFQPQPDVRVMLDPDGHPFCLYT